ncbi:MAG: rhodanese-like domain-containing protein, partial [Rhodothermia bacterium]
EITVKELNERLQSGQDVFLLDVREPFEREIVNIGGVLIPMRTLPDRLDELDLPKDQDIVVYCRSGARSGRVVHWLRSIGYDSALNLKGGVMAWREEIDPGLPGY